MRTLFLVLVTALSIVSSGASAKDINACAAIASALNEIQNTYDQAKFAVDNTAAVCADSNDIQQCAKQLMENLADAAERLAQVQSSYKRAGCQDE